MLKFVKILLDWLYPRDCLSCQTRLTKNSSLQYLCQPCAHKIEWVHSPHCKTCGYPFYGDVSGERVCPKCVELDPVFSNGKTAFLLRGTGRKIIHELKYHRGLYLERDLSALLSQQTEFINFINNAVLVPVPIHAKKERKRGFNQSLFIANVLANAAQNTKVMELLQRTKNTKTQTRMNRQERLKNVRKAFALNKNKSLDPDVRYIIIDDVFTTGSTTNTCAHILKKHGAKHIDILTIGHG